MGIDLVSACVFCAGFLLGGDLPPRDGLSPEIGLSYATLAREIPASGEETYDVSDVTPKFVLIGLGNAHAPPAGLGAGTPAFEWRLRVAFARLSDRCQTLLRLLLADPEPSYQEIGAALGIAVGTIGPARMRCLERLRRSAELSRLEG